MNSTISLFRYLYDNLPPLIPEEIQQKMKHALEHLERDQTITVEDTEDTMVTFGYEIWPWHQAFKEFITDAEAAMGEHFLLPRLDDTILKKYTGFKKDGGTLRDLHSGRAAILFSPEERQKLCSALVETKQDLKKYAIQEILSTATKEYLQRVEEFKKLLKDIKQILQRLKTVADQEQDHPTLAHEIRARIRGFEQSLCHLGPELDYRAVCQTPEFFEERKKHLDRCRIYYLYGRDCWILYNISSNFFELSSVNCSAIDS
jgi:hypothetical protein